MSWACTARPTIHALALTQSVAGLWVPQVLKKLTVGLQQHDITASIKSLPIGLQTSDEGVKLGVSSRGMGSIRKEENCNVVMDDLRLATAADIVADPCAPDAFVDGIMEGKEWVWDNGILKESAVAQIKTEIDEATLINIQERKISAFEAFLKSL